MFAGEDGSVGKHLSQDTADRPDVNCGSCQGNYNDAVTHSSTLVSKHEQFLEIKQSTFLFIYHKLLIIIFIFL